MKNLRFWLTLMAAASVPLFTYMSQRQQRRRGRLHTAADAVRERAGEAGDSARETLGSWGERARDTVGSLTESARDTLGSVGGGTRERAGAAAGATSSLTGRAGAALARAPRLVAQLRGDGDGPYGSDDDWRKYGDVFPN